MPEGWWAGVTLQAPMVFRMRYVAGLAAGADGAAHAAYVGTRPGVVMVDHAQEDAQVHARYLSERPGSTGLFGRDPAVPPDLEAVQSEVRAAPWHWQAILSLREADAEALGYRTPGDWRDLARRAVDRLEAAAGLRSGKLRWVAAMHQKAGHPHVHILCWGPQRNPELSRTELRAVRRGVAQAVYGPLRLQLSAERQERRDRVVRVAMDEMTRAERGLAVRLRALGRAMPPRGRVAMAYQPEAVKAKAREIADWLLAQPAMAQEVAGLEAAARRLAGLYRADDPGLAAAAQRAREDVRDRVAQRVLRSAAGSCRDGRRGARAAAREVVGSARQTLVGETRRAEAEAEAAQRERAAQALGMWR